MRKYDQEINETKERKRREITLGDYEKFFLFAIFFSLGLVPFLGVVI